MKPLLLLLTFFTINARAQQKEVWTNRPPTEWPPIAMINEVWFKNGDQYVHPSFSYVGTAFLIDTGSDTLAATAKHTLWVARNKNSEKVSINSDLKKWLMHPKGDNRDSVVIGQLLNEDSTEILQGKKSTISQRDWLLFSTRYRSKSIQPLKPRYSTVAPGEKAWYAGCPYNDKRCTTHEVTVIEVLGNRIVFSRPDSINLGGASGSPLIDANGHLIGILGGSSVDPFSGKPALYAISTHYLREVLEGKANYNQPLLPLDSVLMPLFNEKGIEAGIGKLNELFSSTAHHAVYNLSSEEVDNLARQFLEAGKPDHAIAIGKFSIAQFKWYARTWNLLADAYVMKNSKEEAIYAYRQALRLWPENKEAQDGLHKLLTQEK